MDLNAPLPGQETVVSEEQAERDWEMFKNAMGGG